tara:strand:- start:120 stop:506 length:387 start_codon:yes stop_codon:yes gene_type:complete
MEDIDKLMQRWTVRWVAFIGLFLGIMFTCWAHGAPDKPIDADMEVKVPGLVCPSCAIGIKRNLKREVNVKYIAFDIIKELVLIDFVEIEGFIHYLKNDKIIKLVKDAGYEVSSIKRLDNNKPNRYNKP